MTRARDDKRRNARAAFVASIPSFRSGIPASGGVAAAAAGTHLGGAVDPSGSAAPLSPTTKAQR